MADNIGVKGLIVDENNHGIEGLTVCAFDIDPITDDDHLGTIKTDGNGEFHIKYTPDKYRLWFADRNPDIEVRIFGPGQRLLWETDIREDFSGETLELEKIIIHSNNFPAEENVDEKEDKSWLVTHTTLDPKNEEAIRLTKSNKVEWLVDGAKMFPTITDAIKAAKQSVKFMNIFFAVGKLFTKFKFIGDQDPKKFIPKESIRITRLEKVMKKKAEDNIPVHVLVWDLHENLLLNRVDTADEVEDEFQGSKVITNFARTTQLLHSKLAVIDGKTAFVIASTMKQGYFSDQEHAIHDVRHQGSLNHDVNAKVEGPAVRDIDQTFSTIWNAYLSPVEVKPAPRIDEEDEPISLQILRTLPGELFANTVPEEESDTEPDIENVPHGETGILEAYQRAIMNAKEYIYIEDQYFTSPEIINAIVQRMQQVEKLEVILVLNFRPDIPGYSKKQAALIKELRDALGEEESKKRLGIFTLWSTHKSESILEVKDIYVHSKLAIIDDKWLTVGSANLEGAALNYRQWKLIMKEVSLDIIGAEGNYVPPWTILWVPLIPFIILAASPILFPLFLPFTVSAIRKETARPSQHVNPHREIQPARHHELNLVMFNGIAGQKPTKKVEELRKLLWTEHLGQAPPEDRPADGWLSLWNAAAENTLENIQKAGRGESFTKPKAKILKYKTPKDQKENIKSMDVRVRNGKLLIRSSLKKIEFTPIDISNE